MIQEKVGTLRKTIECLSSYISFLEAPEVLEKVRGAGRQPFLELSEEMHVIVSGCN